MAEDTELSAQQEAEGGVTQKKVELDLDDAPFLQAEEKSQPPANVNEDSPAAPDDGAAAAALARRRKKRLIIIIAAVTLLLVTGAAVWWFFFRTPPPPPPEGPKPDVIVVPSKKPGAANNEIVREFAPFVVPGRDSQGNTDFLICKFSAITQNPAIQQEMEKQLIPLRDAIYYYLRSKDRAFISDARNGAEIKKELLSVFNDYLTQGKVDDIVFESYLSR